MPSDVCSRPEGNLPDRVTIGLNSKQFIVLTPVSRLVVCVPESLAFKSLFSELEIFFTSLWCTWGIELLNLFPLPSPFIITTILRIMPLPHVHHRDVKNISSSENKDLKASDSGTHTNIIYSKALLQLRGKPSWSLHWNDRASWRHVQPHRQSVGSSAKPYKEALTCWIRRIAFWEFNRLVKQKSQSGKNLECCPLPPPPTPFSNEQTES